jgi:hypothetical protein
VLTNFMLTTLMCLMKLEDGGRGEREEVTPG